MKRIFAHIFTIGPLPDKYETNPHALDLTFQPDGTNSGLPILNDIEGKPMVDSDDPIIKVLKLNHKLNLQSETAKTSDYLPMIKYLENQNDKSNAPTWKLLWNFYGWWTFSKYTKQYQTEINNIFNSNQKTMLSILDKCKDFYIKHVDKSVQPYVKDRIDLMKRKVNNTDYGHKTNLGVNVQKDLVSEPDILPMIKDEINNTESIKELINLDFISADLIVNNTSGDANVKIDMFNQIMSKSQIHSENDNFTPIVQNIKPQPKIDTSIIVNPKYTIDSNMCDYKIILELKANAETYAHAELIDHIMKVFKKL